MNTDFITPELEQTALRWVADGNVPNFTDATTASTYFRNTQRELPLYERAKLEVQGALQGCFWSRIQGLGLDDDRPVEQIISSPTPEQREVLIEFAKATMDESWAQFETVRRGFTRQEGYKASIDWGSPEPYFPEECGGPAWIDLIGMTPMFSDTRSLMDEEFPLFLAIWMTTWMQRYHSNNLWLAELTA